MKLERVLVVGGGMAGLHTVRSLREKGFQGAITFLGAEQHAPYDRPPLSKAVLTGSGRATEQEVGELAFAFDFAEAEVDCRFGERAVAWAPGVVSTETGVELRYDRLVVATGSEPIRLGFGETLRTYEDAVRLRERINGGKPMAIVGAGWIGAEVATAARDAGTEVVIHEARERPLAAVFPPQVGEAMAGWYAQAGAALRCSDPVDGPPPGTDHTLVAVGARPDTRWLGEAFHRAKDGSLLVSEHLETNVPGVFAVGDVAAYRSVRYGGRHIRVEHWDNALRGPQALVPNVLEGVGAAVHDPVPYFWSEQFGRMVQYVGHHTSADRMVLRGDLAAATWSVCWLDPHGRLTAVLAVGRPRDLAQGRRLVTAAAVLDAARVADAGEALTSAVL
ncbi:FAD-dependent oxidoreductase [Catenulispora sp. NF23]|uniref:NAD(P)/FAD-dependent oxidoreductase n=1 Tax=Catenulispora pinistramenti TaxID=2705254 RepID=UPI001BA58520|nr:FAD-dependent oxidoreductase [Catenulispora pinistramenti]MBS2536844.1 FAD-dependent oxidoreductase [Catenulispora pinistramenti]